jgi:hypothetical protein
MFRALRAKALSVLRTSPHITVLNHGYNIQLQEYVPNGSRQSISHYFLFD